MFVGDFADDFFDEVFKGCDARGSAVFVEDHGKLQGALAQPGEQRVQVQGFGHLQHVFCEGAGFKGFADLRGHTDCLLHVHDAHNVVVVALVKGESGMAGGACQLDDFGNGGGVFEHGDLPARGHHFGGGQLGEAQGAVHKACRVGVKGAFFCGAAHHGGELFGGACRGELFFGFHAEASEDPVGGAVHEAHEWGHDPGECQLCGGNSACHGVGGSNGEALGQQLANNHGQQGCDEHCQQQGEHIGHAAGQPHAVDYTGGERLDGGIESVAGQQRGDGDANLAAGQLSGEGFEATQDSVCGFIAGVFCLLHGRSFECHEGELYGDKEAGTQDEE